MTRMRLAAIAAALVMGAAGCGGDDGDDAPEGNASAPAAEETAPSTLELTLSGSGKNVTMEGPDSVEGGVVEISLTTELKGDHAAQLIRVDGEHTAEEVSAAGEAWGGKGQPLAEWMHLEGGVTAKPGETVTAVQVLEPGRYVAVDISSDEKVQPALEFEVTEGEGELPEAEARVEMKEYSFTATDLAAGGQQVLVENTGSQPHFIVGAPIAEGATIEDVKTFFESEKGKPPVDFQQSFSTAVMDGDRSQIVELDLKAGTYAFVCFVPDRSGGPPHVAKGMVSEVTVG